MKMFSSIVVSVAILCAQISGPVSSFELDSNGLFQGALGEVAYSSGDDFGGVQLVARGLNDGNGGVTRELDAQKAISALGRIGLTAAQKTATALTNLVNNFGESSLVGQLFAHVRYLIQNQNLVKQFPGSSIPASGVFPHEFTREALLADIENLSAESVANGKRLLNPLVQSYKNVETGLLFSNVYELLDLQPALKRYGQLCESVDEAFGLNKPIDVSMLPVPTQAQPEVYFELVDETLPNAKFLVRVKRGDGALKMTILIRAKGQTEGYNSVAQEYNGPDDDNDLIKLYQRLPISRFIQKE